MWLVALLVNSNTLEEMGTIWRNICIVLLSPSQNDQFKLSLSTLSKMADDMNKDPDKTNFILQHVSISAKGQCSSSMVTEVRSKTVSLNQDALEWNEYHSAKHEHLNRWYRLAWIDSKEKREREKDREKFRIHFACTSTVKWTSIIALTPEREKMMSQWSIVHAHIDLRKIRASRRERSKRDKKIGPLLRVHRIVIIFRTMMMSRTMSVWERKTLFFRWNRHSRNSLRTSIVNVKDGSRSTILRHGTTYQRIPYSR